MAIFNGRSACSECLLNHSARKANICRYARQMRASIRRARTRDLLETEMSKARMSHDIPLVGLHARKVNALLQSEGVPKQDDVPRHSVHMGQTSSGVDHALLDVGIAFK